MFILLVYYAYSSLIKEVAMKYDLNVPIYLQVMNSLKKKLVAGMIKPGDQLPATRSLAIEYDINPNTAARVYKEMELQGICYTKRGEGTYVTESTDMIPQIREDMAKKVIDRFMREMTDLGYSTGHMIEKIKSKEDDYK